MAWRTGMIGEVGVLGGAVLMALLPTGAFVEFEA